MHTHKDEAELKVLAFQICEMLEGIPLGQALWLVADEVPSLLKDGHLVETTRERFKNMSEAFRVSVHEDS